MIAVFPSVILFNQTHLFILLLLFLSCPVLPCPILSYPVLCFCFIFKDPEWSLSTKQPQQLLKEGIVEYLQTDVVSIWQAEMLWPSCRDHKLGLWAEDFTIILFVFLGLRCFSAAVPISVTKTWFFRIYCLC